MKLIVFTPTYNRKDLLLGLYESICTAHLYNNKTDHIEWLIVDDGSEISIQEEVMKFPELYNMKIRVIHKDNGGKHTAFNTAIDESDGDLFVCIDDDDRITENFIRDVVFIAKKYKLCSQDSKYGAIVGRVVDENHRLLGRTIKGLPFVSNTIEIRDKYHFWGEPEVYVVEKLKKYRFPVFEGEKFLTEAILFDEMSIKYPFIYTNSIFMVKKYLPGGLTDNQLKIRILSPYGTEEYYNKRKYLAKGFLPILKATINRQRFSYWCDKRKRRKIDVFEVLAFPLSIIMYIKDHRDFKRQQ